jgi:broad specificity phosphatase PhoE
MCGKHPVGVLGEGSIERPMPVIVVVRPGATEFDEQQRIQGTLDLPLSEKGVGQVERMASLLERYLIDRLYSAPGEPARTTAGLLGERLGVSPKEYDNLRGRDEGLWQGLTHEALKRKQPRLYRQWVETPYAVCPPGGELLESVIERCGPMVARLQALRGAVAVVAPEPVAQVLSCLLRGLDPAAESAWQPLEPGQAEVIEIGSAGATPNVWGERVALLGEEQLVATSPMAAGVTTGPVSTDSSNQEGRGGRE